MIIQCVTDSFLLELGSAIHDFTSDTFKMALYTEDADLDKSTSAYTTTGEVSGVGYVAGGVTLVKTSGFPQISNRVFIMDWADPVWAASSITARGAMIYNSSKANRAVLILDFGHNKTSNPDFTVIFPAADSNSSIVRIK